MSKQEFYDSVAKELEQESIDRGLWTKAFAEADGDRGRARALYIRLRVDQLERDALAHKPESRRRLTNTDIILLTIAIAALIIMLAAKMSH